MVTFSNNTMIIVNINTDLVKFALIVFSHWSLVLPIPADIFLGFFLSYLAK
jgi:hypothetical protein